MKIFKPKQPYKIGNYTTFGDIKNGRSIMHRQKEIIRELNEQIEILNRKKLKMRNINELVAISKSIARLELAISLIDNYWWEED